MGGKEGWQTHWPRSPPQQEDEKRKGWGGQWEADDSDFP